MKKMSPFWVVAPSSLKPVWCRYAIAVNGQFQEVLVHTGQHFDTNMSDVFFAELGMNKPDSFWIYMEVVTGL